jgi:hypothetical protein
MDRFTLFSQIALVLFIPVSISLFFVLRPQRAALVAILGGDMFLPELVNFKLPFLPPLEKHNLPYICVLIGCLLRRRSLLTVCKERWYLFFVFALVAGAAVTGLTNGEPVAVERFHPPCPGIHLTDGLYSAAVYLSVVMLPFYLGWALFRSESELRALLAAIVLAALIYVPFVFWELRMSPNLHLWVYGYMQHDFAQTIRGTGYRPMVFMTHGLSLARFLFIGTCSAMLLGRLKGTVWGVPARPLGWFLLVVLILCKSVGAIAFALVAVPLLIRSKPATQVRVAFVVALFVGLYPLLRASDLIPTEQILSATRALVGEDRTESLGFRFMNEGLLLEKARRHLAFGWGQYGRNFAPMGWDGRAVADGYWVIQIGILGLVGFITTFGTMLVPLLLVRSRLKAIVYEPHRILIAGVALTSSLVALDWIPNGLFAPYPYLIVGALAGASRELGLSPAAIAQRAGRYGLPLNLGVVKQSG